jgi:hypothetical protein
MRGNRLKCHHMYAMAIRVWELLQVIYPSSSIDKMHETKRDGEESY